MFHLLVLKCIIYVCNYFQVFAKNCIITYFSPACLMLACGTLSCVFSPHFQCSMLTSSRSRPLPFIFISDYGDQSMDVLSMHFREPLLSANVAIAVMKDEWLELKSRIYSRVEVYLACPSISKISLKHLQMLLKKCKA